MTTPLTRQQLRDVVCLKAIIDPDFARLLLSTPNLSRQQRALMRVGCMTPTAEMLQEMSVERVGNGYVWRAA